MSSHYQYYGSAAHRAADLKRTLHRVRTERPEMFVKKTIVETRMDGEGKVTKTERTDAIAAGPTPARRHHMAYGR